MPRRAEVCTNGGPVKVGTTGKIGFLMTRELESMSSPRSPTSAHRKLQTSSVSVLCGDAPRKPRSSISNVHNYQRNPPGAAQTLRYSSRRSSAQRVPMLGSERNRTDRNLDTRKMERRKDHAYVVEVVDVKCGRPMSSRLRKLGFSKLSETVA